MYKKLKKDTLIIVLVISFCIYLIFNSYIAFKLLKIKRKE